MCGLKITAVLLARIIIFYIESWMGGDVCKKNSFLQDTILP